MTASVRARKPVHGTAVVVALAFGLVLLAEVFLAPPALFGGVDNPGAWFPPRSRAELLVAKMDGHTFAQIAQDPTMARSVADYHGDDTNAAYRASRPVMGWLAFVASAGGQRDLVAPAILVLTALSAGLLVAAVDFLGRSLGRRVRLLILIPLMPAMVAAVAYPGVAEPLACALVLFGLGFWSRDRIWPAVAFFAAAGLARETMLLVPFALGLERLISSRRVGRTVASCWPLVLAPAAYLGWVAVVYQRIGALPSAYSPMSGLLVGFRQGFPNWRLAEYLTAVLLVGSAVVIVRRGPRWMWAILGVHAVFYLFMNYQVWWVWLGFGRVGTLIPLLAFVALLPESRPPEDGTDRAGPTDTVEEQGEPDPSRRMELTGAP